MSDTTSKKDGKGQAGARRKKGRNEPIRLEDLIPRQDVTGGRRIVFGVKERNHDRPKQKER